MPPVRPIRLDAFESQPSAAAQILLERLDATSRSRLRVHASDGSGLLGRTRQAELAVPAEVGVHKFPSQCSGPPGFALMFLSLLYAISVFIHSF